jgi:hypothetical protein
MMSLLGGAADCASTSVLMPFKVIRTSFYAGS